MYRITSLHLYPIKSLGGINLQTATLSNTGIEHDRAWMLVDEQDRFITQREVPDLALFRLSYSKTGFVIDFNGNKTEISFTPLRKSPIIKTKVFKDEVYGLAEEETINTWFSSQLNQNVRLIRTTETHPRYVANHPEASVNYPDSHQYLILGEASMQGLNDKLDTALNINRFRANIIFEGGQAHAEDEWQQIRIGNSVFANTKRCGRCKITTVEQETAKVGLEPLQTLSTYRKFGRRICFGHYLKLLRSTDNCIRVGDELIVER